MGTFLPFSVAALRVSVAARMALGDNSSERDNACAWITSLSRRTKKRNKEESEQLIRASAMTTLIANRYLPAALS